jgi:hypothetical protein
MVGFYGYVEGPRAASMPADTIWWMEQKSFPTIIYGIEIKLIIFFDC